jgi:hypothetical protein
MRTVAGVVVGLFTIVLVVMGLGLRATTTADARQVAAPEQIAQAVPVSGGSAQAVAVPTVPADQAWQGGAQPTLVNCGPGMQALVRPVVVGTQQVSQVECVAAVAPGVVYPAQVRTVVEQEPEVRMTRRVRSYDEQPAPRRVARPHRSWQKTALVIGGSTATGAGIGGLIGGKKGALIGAAIGGGASTIFEAGKRR